MLSGPSNPGAVQPLCRHTTPCRRRLGAVTTLVLLATAGCDEVDNPYFPFPEPSHDLYVATVQPVVDRECAFVGCHGALERTLTLYAVEFLRAPAPFAGAPLSEGKLSPGELAWNYDAMRMRLIGETSADDARLLLKCLDPEQGGIAHADTVVFATRDDPGFVRLRDWIQGGL